MDNNIFKTKHSFDKRKDEADKILKKYPDKCPIIVTKSAKTNIDPIDKNKFLI